MGALTRRDDVVFLCVFVCFVMSMVDTASAGIEGNYVPWPVEA